MKQLAVLHPPLGKPPAFTASPHSQCAMMVHRQSRAILIEVRFSVKSLGGQEKLRTKRFQHSTQPHCSTSGSALSQNSKIP